MKRYTFVCELGHERGVFFGRDLTAGVIAEMSVCDCGRRAKVTRLPDVKTFFVKPGFEPHYNMSLDRPVNTLRELRDIQKQYADAGTPIADWEPTGKQSSDWKEKGQAGAEAGAQAVEEAVAYDREHALPQTEREGEYVVPVD